MSKILNSHSGEYEMILFRVIAQYSLVEVDKRFKGACCHRHQGDLLELLELVRQDGEGTEQPSRQPSKYCTVGE